MKVAILGWYGHNNIGDEAILEGLQYLFNKFFNTTEFNVMTNVQTDSVPQFTLEKANDADLFVYGGGEIINPRHMFVARKCWLRWIHEPKIIMGCGVNARQYGEFQDHIKPCLRGFKYIGLRDEVACNILREDPELQSKIVLTLDPSMILREKYGLNWNSTEKVGVIIPTDRTHRDFDRGILTTNIVASSRSILKQKLLLDGIRQIKLVALGKEDNDDAATCRQLKDYLSEFDVSIYEPLTVKDALDLLCSCQKIYTYRLHGLVFAHVLGIPYSYFSYHHKLERAHATLRKFSPEMALNRIMRVWSDLKIQVERRS